MNVDIAKLTTGKYFDTTTPIWFGYEENKPTYTFTSVPSFTATFVENEYRKKLFVNKDSLSVFRAPSSVATGLNAIGGSLNFRGCSNLSEIRLEGLEKMDSLYMDNLPSLSYTRISSCDFNKCFMENCEYLQALYIKNTQIDNLSFDLCNQLQIVTLIDNKNEKYYFTDKPTLTELKVESNTNLKELYVTNCGYLGTIDAMGNNLNKIDISGSNSLFYLNLDNNNFGSTTKLTVDITGLSSLSSAGDKYFSVRNCNMTVYNLNSLFGNLPSKGGLSGTWTIYIKDNIGTENALTGVAISKGWVVNKTT
jgi:hypothetical protein